MSYISKQLYHQDIWKDKIRQGKIEQDRIVGYRAHKCEMK